MATIQAPAPAPVPVGEWKEYRIAVLGQLKTQNTKLDLLTEKVTDLQVELASIKTKMALLVGGGSIGGGGLVVLLAQLFKTLGQ